MKGVTLRAWHGDRYLGLRDVLAALGDRTENLQWRLHLEEIAPGPHSPRLEAMNPDAWLDTPTLLGIAEHDVQIIDGELSGYRPGQHDAPYVTIRAADSTWWDVESDDDDLTALVRHRLPDVEEMPP